MEKLEAEPQEGRKGARSSAGVWGAEGQDLLDEDASRERACLSIIEPVLCCLQIRYVIVTCVSTGVGKDRYLI